jgi:hypothetical protein
MTDDEAAALLADLLNRFDLDYWSLPPTGLPGFTRDGYDPYSPEAELLDLGISYLLAMIRKEPRSMHLRWQEAQDFIRKIETDAEGKAITEWLASSRDEVERKQNAQLAYFIGAPSGPVKIGIAVCPGERLKTLQTSHHERLELLATCQGGQPKERAYHQQFAAYRLHGEWFERCPEIEAEIARLNSDAPNPNDDRGDTPNV